MKAFFLNFFFIKICNFPILFFLISAKSLNSGGKKEKKKLSLYLTFTADLPPEAVVKKKSTEGEFRTEKICSFFEKSKFRTVWGIVLFHSQSTAKLLWFGDLKIHGGKVPVLDSRTSSTLIQITDATRKYFCYKFTYSSTENTLLGTCLNFYNEGV